MSQGSYKIWPATAAGEPLGNPTPPTGQPVESPNPMDEKATDIYFGVVNTVPQPPPKDQLELQQDIEKVLRTVQLIYGHPVAGSVERCKSQFRSYYMRLFRLAQLGLEGPDASPEISKSALATVSANLIDDEASRVKNGHLVRLGGTAIVLALPFILLYLVMRITPPNDGLANLLLSFGIERVIFANFMLLWVGCFIGVWLSYGIRTSVFTLTDLTVTDSDRLLPVIRLLFAGSLTMILGIMFMLGVVQISLGNHSLTDFSTSPMLAFLVGTLCGISELLLPTTVGKRASDFINQGK
ncbi:hypothetical protein EBAPG3_013820 [Nitrosospira lacus]|uniref:Uncharacterized protein n=2 Tax=Nitrosospira lacus TaxID=1288494 RepID=A0A1W6SSG9_9PROT|nr:hypothetical protein EBAPG3_013820 [Nitrosospira lacus]